MSDAREKLRILVADDNRDAGATLALVLRARQYDVLFADNGRSAFEVALEFRPHAGIFDIGMPGMTGFELARYIRAEPWGRRAVLIALSGWCADEHRSAAYAVGFDHHVTKPADIDQISELLFRGIPERLLPAPDAAAPGLAQRAMFAAKTLWLRQLAQWPKGRALSVHGGSGRRSPF